MKRLCSSPFHANVLTVLAKHLELLRVVQAQRKNEIANARCRDKRVVLALAEALQPLTLATCKVRTVLWCAFQMTLIK
ncbi:MEIOC protein, partial [Spelaeornis formosus]|nr:MEIOC protein [Elachura formosa]